MILENINSPEDVKKMSREELNLLSGEIREALLHRLSDHGGHFGPNFGMVEATIALHYVFNSPEDKIVFDVSHQSYPHKMLTGRKDAYLYPENTMTCRATPSRRKAHTTISSSAIPPPQSAWPEDWPKAVT